MFIRICICLGFYILGRELAVPRDRSKDYKTILKYTIFAPLTVPYYIYTNKGLPKIGRDKRRRD
jgi:hypothetical protein